jgi:hypothetical protein
MYTMRVSPVMKRAMLQADAHLEPALTTVRMPPRASMLANNGWSLVAIGGKLIGYIAARDLAPIASNK